MNLETLQQAASKGCRCYDNSHGDHRCTESEFIPRTCFLFENVKLPSPCRNFEELLGITLKELDRIWQRDKRITRPGHNAYQCLRQAVIQRIKEAGEVTQVSMIQDKVFPERTIKYHWKVLIQELGLVGELQFQGRRHTKAYRASKRQIRTF